MKVRYIGTSVDSCFRHGVIYDVDHVINNRCRCKADRFKLYRIKQMGVQTSCGMCGMRYPGSYFVDYLFKKVVEGNNNIKVI